MRYNEVRCGILLLVVAVGAYACSHNVVSVSTLSNGSPDGMSAEERKRISKLREAGEHEENADIREVVGGETPRISVEEYLAKYPEYGNSMQTLYRVGDYDVLRISVYGEDDLSVQSVTVGGDGYVPFPLIGRVKVQGMTQEEIGEILAKKLAEGDFLLNAQVTVGVVEYNSRKYSVFGEVPTAGTFRLKANERLLDAFSNMGNVDWGSAAKEAIIIRTQVEDGNHAPKVIITVDLQALLKGERPNTNLLLRDQDIIYVPEGYSYYLLGQVNSTGAYKLPEEGVNLSEAIARAGGFTPLAARNRTRIIRVEDGVEKIITVKVDAIMRSGRKIQDIPVKPNDIIVVPESFF